MKKQLLTLSLLFATALSWAQWQYVGSPGFSNGNSGYQFIDVEGTNMYVAFRDSSLQKKATVVKYNGADWDTVGNQGFTPHEANYVNLKIHNDVPYIAYQDSSMGGKISVMKFDGANWVNVGAPGISNGLSYYPYMDFYNNELYIIYTDFSNGFKASVQKYDGSNWSFVGNDGFTATFGLRPSIEFLDSVPYIAFRQGNAEGGGLSVMKWDYGISDWTYIGDTTVSAGRIEHPNLTIFNQQPVVTYGDYAVNGKASVQIFDGTNWNYVGSQGFSPDTAGFADIHTDGALIYTAYTDRSQNDRVRVQYFNNGSGNWDDVGSNPISTGDGYTISFGIYMSIPFIAFRDGDYYKRTSVMKFDTTGNKPAVLTLSGGTLTSNIKDAYYMWYDCNTDELISADSSNSFTPSSSGSYYAVISNTGYLDTCVCVDVTVTVNSLSVSDKSIINVYPNPVANTVQISSDKSIRNVQIRDVHGREILSKNLNKNQELLYLNVESGSYILQVTTEDGLQQTTKIIKE